MFGLKKIKKASLAKDENFCMKYFKNFKKKFQKHRSASIHKAVANKKSQELEPAIIDNPNQKCFFLICSVLERKNDVRNFI